MFRVLHLLLIGLVTIHGQNFSDDSLFERPQLEQRKLTTEIKVKAKVAYFRNPAVNPRNSPTHIMKLQLINENICQIRVDINSMYLQEPVAEFASIRPLPSPPATFSVSCLEDRFSVDFSDQDVRLPEICGTTTNTHFYINLGQNKNIKIKSVNFIVSLGATGRYPAWDIKATQLECPGKNNDPQNYRDFDRLAPPGCLQYFQEPSGSFHSFGWNTNFMDSTLTTSQDYAICFKRVLDSCGIRFAPNFFGLWDYTPDPNPTPILCRYSYIYTPEPKTIANAPVLEKQCPDAVTTVTTPWSSEHPGPLYIHFHVDAMVALWNSETIRRGFDIKYSNLGTCTP